MPLGHDEEGACLVLDDFVEDAVEEGPGWVDVGTDLVPAVGKRVASKCVGVIGIRGEVGGKLVMLRGGEDIRFGVELEVGANVAEDDGVEHDIFVGSTGEGDLWDRECDALGERGTEPARREDLSLGGRVSWSLGTRGSLFGGEQELERGGGESSDSASRGERRGTAGTQRVLGDRRTTRGLTGAGAEGTDGSGGGGS